MKLAFIRAGLWALMSLIFTLIVFGDGLTGESNKTILLTFLVIGALFGIVAFFYTWSESAKKDRN